MGQIKVTTCEIEGLKVIEPRVFGDERGYFFESYNYNDFKEAGIPQVFVQDNQSASKRGVLRGLHFQKNFDQWNTIQQYFDIVSTHPHQFEIRFTQSHIVG